MPFESSVVGTEAEPYIHRTDSRWGMNYAAAIGDENPTLLDTRRDRLVIHPMYLSFPEWESMQMLMPSLRLSDDERERSVEMHHDTELYQPLVAGMDLYTVSSVRAVQEHRAGTQVIFTVKTTDTAGTPVGTSTVQALYRDVDLIGESRGKPIERDAIVSNKSYSFDTVVPLSIPATACHVYSECARIWNPFHTDISVAERVGIHGLILHGTATLARVVSEICNAYESLSIETVSRVNADLRAMVIVPTSLKLELAIIPTVEDQFRRVAFQLRTQEGDFALKRGSIEFQI